MFPCKWESCKKIDVFLQTGRIFWGRFLEEGRKSYNGAEVFQMGKEFLNGQIYSMKWSMPRKKRPLAFHWLFFFACGKHAGKSGWKPWINWGCRGFLAFAFRNYVSVFAVSNNFQLLQWIRLSIVNVFPVCEVLEAIIHLLPSRGSLWPTRRIS